MLNWDNSSAWTYPGCYYWTDSRENYFFENPQERSWLRTNTKLKKNAENSKTETRLCIITPAHTVHSYEIVKDNKGGYYDGVAPGLLFHCSSKLHHPDDHCCCCILTYHSSWGLVHIFCLLSSGACADLIFVIFLHKYTFWLIFSLHETA